MRRALPGATSISPSPGDANTTSRGGGGRDGTSTSSAAVVTCGAFAAASCVASIDVEVEPTSARAQTGHPHGAFGAANDEVIAAAARRPRQIAKQVPPAKVADDGN